MRGRAREEPPPLPLLSRSRRPRTRTMSLKDVTKARREGCGAEADARRRVPPAAWKSCRRPPICVRGPLTGGYSGGPLPVLGPASKEAPREGARPVSARQPLLGFPGRNLGRKGARVLAGGRQPGGAPAPREDHRRKGRGRSPHHAGRLSEGAHPGGYLGREGPRAAPALLRQLIAAAAVVTAGCDLGSPEPERKAGADLHVVSVFPEDGAGTDCDLEAPPTCGVLR